MRARAALACFALFAVALVVLHLDAWLRHLSDYAHGPRAVVWSAGLAAFALGLVLLGRAIPEGRPADLGGRTAAACLQASGALSAIMLVIPVDLTAHPTTWKGYVHGLAAAASLTLAGCAMFLLARAARRHSAWRAVAPPGPWWQATFLVGFTWGLGDFTRFWPIASVLERVTAVLLLAWLAAVAVRLVRRQRLDHNLHAS